ncbi:MAG: DeoR family transcriptional regulator [Candidatus Andersenbacteria bacterium]|nr:DeoR family transcriptional regulator [Candidatus Andersenbacteria bacterium]
MEENTPQLPRRQAILLSGMIAEYIRTGRPVGSEYLTDALGLQVSPATVRHDLRDLEEEGYINQPHTSAGRIPTDKGYRFYVNNLVAQDISRRQEAQIEKRLEAMNIAYGRPSRATAKLLSELSHSLAISGWMKAKDVQESGLAQVLQDSDNQAEALQEITEILEHVDSYLQALSEKKEEENGTAIYIGSENPLYDAVHTSTLVRTVHLDNGETIVLLVVGPKRMPYQRNVALLNSVASILYRDLL